MTQIVNLTINQGSSFKFLAHVQETLPDGCVGNACSILDIDLTNKGIRSQMRQTVDSCKAYDFVCNATNAIEGKFESTMTASYTATIPAGNYVYDIEIYDINDPDNVFKPFSGNITVIPEVTR